MHVKILSIVESNAGAVPEPPRLSRTSSVPQPGHITRAGFPRALIEPGVRFSRTGLSDRFHA